MRTTILSNIGGALRRPAFKTSKMKTRLHWFTQFPEPYRAYAIANTSTAALYAMFPSAYAALMAAFDWSDSPQGFNYWFEFQKTLSNELPNTRNG